LFFHGAYLRNPCYRLTPKHSKTPKNPTQKDSAVRAFLRLCFTAETQSTQRNREKRKNTIRKKSAILAQFFKNQSVILLRVFVPSWCITVPCASPRHSCESRNPEDFPKPAAYLPTDSLGLRGPFNNSPTITQLRKTNHKDTKTQSSKKIEKKQKRLHTKHPHFIPQFFKN
jgi:hypothetical protein